MRIGCLQFAPRVGDIDNNLNRADAVLSKSQDLNDLDVLVLPELAFTGYNFHSLAEISPYLEPSGSGVSSLWARTTALKLNCNVIVGYPEKVDVANKWPTSPEFYNSAIMVNRDGETIANYRKSFLYAVDETWALEGGEGFLDMHVPDLGDMAMGICMDINPYKFEAPWHAFEFAFHVLEVQANLVILTMAWLTREDTRSFSQLPQEPDMETFMYWIQGLEPIVRDESEEEIIIVVCNRTGIEEDCVYAGTSTVFGIKQGEVNLYGILGRGVKELLVVDTSIPSFAKVVKADASEVVESDSAASKKSSTSQVPTEQHNAAAHSRRPAEVSAQGSSSRVPGQQQNAAAHLRKPFADVAAQKPPSQVPVQKKSAAASLRKPFAEASSQTLSNRHDMVQGDVCRPRECIVSDAASVFSSKSVGSQASMRPLAPKLELQIPPDSRVPAASRRLGSPDTALMEQASGEADIPTPTAPSPTPISIRPTFNLPDSGRPVQSAIETSYSRGPVNRRAGMSAVETTARVGFPPTPPTQPQMNRATSVALPFQHDGREPARVPTNRVYESATDSMNDIHLQNIPPVSESQPKQGTPSGQKEASAMGTRTVQDAISDEAATDSGIGSLSDAEMEQFSEMMRELGTPQSNVAEPPSPVTLPVRPPSTKSRNASRSRTEQAVPNTGLHRSLSQPQMSFPYVGSPSDFYRSVAQIGHCKLSESPMQTSAAKQVPSRSTSESQPVWSSHEREMTEKRDLNLPQTVYPEKKILQNGSRSVSRGRQPSSKTYPTNGRLTNISLSSVGTGRVMSHSADRRRPPSNNNSVITRGATASTTSTASSASWLFGTPPPRTQPELDPDDEIVAMINLVNRSCPVHNQTPPVQQQQQQQRQALAYPSQYTAGPGQGQSHSSVAVSPPLQAAGYGSPLALEDSIYEVILPPNIRELVNSFASPGQHNSTPLRGRDLSRGHASPKFDPPTPTAMSYDSDIRHETTVPLPSAALTTKQEC